MVRRCLWFWALKILDTTEALGALALGKRGGAFNIGTVDLSRGGGAGGIGSERAGNASSGKIK